LSSVFIRTVAVYVSLIAVMRFLGKRQIGEMQISELVTAFLLSELASTPLTNENIPLAFSLIPIITLVCIEVIFSFLPTKFSFFKKIVDSTPSILIKNGKPDIREMLHMRMTLEDLICELHLAGYSTPEEIEYAILEPNGKIAFFAKDAPPAVQGIAHPIIIDGKINAYALSAAGKNRDWLFRELKKKKLEEKSIFLMTADDGGCIKIITKKELEK
jgi:uncharacterized membrane protein YcaP (DUF421 family)